MLCQVLRGQEGIAREHGSLLVSGWLSRIQMSMIVSKEGSDVNE